MKVNKKYLDVGGDINSFRYNSGMNVKYPVLKGVLNYIGEKLDKYVFRGMNKFLGYGYEPEAVRSRNATEELYQDEPAIEIKNFDPEKSKKGAWAYTKIKPDGTQTVYLPYRDKVRGLLPEEFWHYLEGGTFKVKFKDKYDNVKQKYVQVKQKVKNAVDEFLYYLLDHEVTHPKYIHLKNDEREEINTEVDTVGNSTQNGKSFREHLHAYGLVMGDWLSKKVANVKEGVKYKWKEYKNYMETLGFDLKPAEVRV